MDHLTSEIVIGSSSNPAEPGFSACRVLAGREANPCRKLSYRVKMATVVNRCNDRSCDHGTDARQLRQSMDVSRARRSVGVGGWNARIYPACCGTICAPGLDGSPLLLAS